MIYYNYFSEGEIFADPRLNVFCNQMFTSLINAFGFEKVTTGLLVDGMVAVLIQDEEPTVNQNKIELSTSDQEIFRFLKLSNVLDVSSSVLGTDNVVFVLKSGYSITVNFTLKEMTSIIFRDIHFRTYSEII